MMRERFGRYLSYEEVTNGIAYNPDRDTFFVTGKRWPVLFEVKLNV